MLAVKTLVTALTCGLFLSNLAQADTLVSFDGRDQKSKTSRDEVCRVVHAGLNIERAENVNCLYRDPHSFVDQNVEKEIRSGFFSTYFDITEKAKELTVRVRLLQREQDEVEQVRYVFRMDDDANWKNDLFNLAKNFSAYQATKTEFKAHLLTELLPLGSKLVEINKQGQFIDKSTGELLNTEDAYFIYRTESENHIRSTRLAFEMVGYFGFITYRYLRNKANKVDWDYNLETGLKEKFITGSAIRFDDNAVATNTGHTYAGVLYYGLCRANGLNPVEAAICNVFATAGWELGTEYREVLSINDVITTAIGGSIVGEVARRTSVAVLQKVPGAVGRILGGLIDPFAQMNRWHDREKMPDAYKNYSELSLSVGYLKRDEKGMASFRADAKVVDLPIREGKTVRALIPGVFESNLRFQVDQAGTNGRDTVRFLTQLAYGAIYKHELSVDEKERLNGYQLILSSASAYEELYRNFDDGDFFAAVNVIGPRVQINGFVKGVKVSLTLEAYADFVMVHSFALEEYAEENGIQGLLSTINPHEYYYGRGYTGRSEFTVESQKVLVGVRARDSEWDAIRTRDRYQDRVTKNIRYSDAVETIEMFVQYRPTKTLAFELAHETFRREGWIEGGYRDRKSEKRVVGRLIYKF